MDLHFIATFFPPEAFLAFLRTVVIDTPYIYVDLWTFVHIGAGAIISLATKKYFPAIAIILGFELFESILMQQGIIRPETAVDLIYDIIFTFVGYFAAERINDKLKYF